MLKLLLLILASMWNCEGFHRETMGVVFSAYVKLPEGESNSIPNWKSYNLKDVETMLSIVSTKFSRVATYGVGADNVPYQEGITYNQSNAQVLAAEAAAKINQGRGEKTLTMLIGIWQSSERTQMNSELQVALESAKIANGIFDGTVEALILSGNGVGSSLAETRRTLKQLRILRKETARRNLNLKLGSRQACTGFSDEVESDELKKVRLEIVRESDFIICLVFPRDDRFSAGGEAGFKFIKSDLLNYRTELKRINPDIEVMGETGWPSDGDKDWQNVQNMEEYSKAMNRFSSVNNFPMWMFEAFNQPWKSWAPSEPHYGWWQLKRNDLIGKPSGYNEKISGSQMSPRQGTRF